MRACLQIADGMLRIERRDELDAEPAGDLLQAGPLLVADGRRAIADGEDGEGFSAAAHQFDSDITQGRYPRAALGIAGERLLAVACDGRTYYDAGMTLAELANALLELGATDALNLDGVAGARRAAVQPPARGARHRSARRAADRDRGDLRGAVGGGAALRRDRDAIGSKRWGFAWCRQSCSRRAAAPRT